MSLSGYPVSNEKNYEVFRECISGFIVQKSEESLANAKRKELKPRRYKKTASDIQPRENPEDLADFIEYIATETFSALPNEAQALSYHNIQKNEALATRYAEPISQATFDNLVAAVPVSVSESLVVYGLISEQSDYSTSLKSILCDYLYSVTAKPRVTVQDKATACEICDRDWIPLTDHHLIPRSVHAKVLKRGWHEEWTLNNLAQICGACHKYVHRIASNEELAKEWYTVEKLLDREDVQDWAKWVGKLRWKGR